MLILSHWVHHFLGWCLCTFSFLPNFVAMTQNLSVSDDRFEEFSMPSLLDFVNGDQEELLLCPVIAVKRYLRSIVDGLFVSTGRWKVRVAHSAIHTIFFWLRSVIRHTYSSTS